MNFLENYGEICFYTGICSTLVFIAKTFIPADFGTEVGGDFTTITDTDGSFTLFSIESISAFFMCASWIGWIAQHTEIKNNPAGVIAISIIFGLIGMFFYAFLISMFRKLEQTNVVDYSKLVGLNGKAYIRFAPKGASKIQIETENGLETLDAINNSEETINSFDPIKIVKFENNILYIEKL